MKTLLMLLTILLVGCQGQSGENTPEAAETNYSPIPVDDETTDYVGPNDNTIMLEVGSYKSECFIKYGEIHGYYIYVNSDYTMDIMELNSMEESACASAEYSISATYNINGDRYDFVETQFTNITQQKTLCGLPKVNYAINMDGINCADSYEFQEIKFIENEYGEITFKGIKINKL